MEDVATASRDLGLIEGPSAHSPQEVGLNHLFRLYGQVCTPMNEASIGPRYLMRWDHSRDQRLLDDVVTTTHRLGELPQFSDQGLAEILDRYPRDAISITTMGDQPIYPNQIRCGLLGSHNGKTLIETVRRGRLRLRLCQLRRHFPPLAGLVQRLHTEMTECQPGLRTADLDGELEISSPHALSYFRFDIKPNVGWQIRGSRQVFAYPAKEPFLQSGTLNEVIAGRFNRPHYFEPAFDDLATIHQLCPSDMLGLKHLMPHRSINDASLNVVLTSNYWTHASMRRIRVQYANHLISQVLPGVRSTQLHGIVSALKCYLLRTPDRISTTSWLPDPSFLVDPRYPNCVAPLNAAGRAPERKNVGQPEPESTIPNLSVSNFNFETSPFISTSAEN